LYVGSIAGEKQSAKRSKILAKCCLTPTSCLKLRLGWIGQFFVTPTASISRHRRHYIMSYIYHHSS